jgi:hypothetical protein
MWVFIFLLDLLGRKNFLRFLAGWTLIMLFFIYCLVHNAFDHPFQMVVPRTIHRPVNAMPVTAPER